MLQLQAGRASRTSRTSSRQSAQSKVALPFSLSLCTGLDLHAQALQSTGLAETGTRLTATSGMILRSCPLILRQQRPSAGLGQPAYLAAGHRQPACPAIGCGQAACSAVAGTRERPPLLASIKRSNASESLMLAAMSLHYHDPLRTVGATLVQKADEGSSRAAELLQQWDESKNLASPEGEPWWIHECPKCGRSHSWQAKFHMRLSRGETACRRRACSCAGIRRLWQATTALTVLGKQRRASAAAWSPPTRLLQKRCATAPGTGT